jgi:hypothetical protein
MTNYLANNAEFCSLSPFNEDQAAELEAKRPGHLMALCAAASGIVDARGAKRGDVPFKAPYPIVVKQWVADLVTPRAYRSLGVRPTDEQQEDITQALKDAREDLKEFANPQLSLLLLPLQQGGAQDSQETAPPTLAYSEASPFTWKHRQAEAVRSNRRYG